MHINDLFILYVHCAKNAYLLLGKWLNIILYYDQQMYNYLTNYHTHIICEIIVHLLVIVQNKSWTIHALK